MDEGDQLEKLEMTTAAGSADVNDTSMDFSLSSKKKKKKKVIVDDVDEDKQGLRMLAFLLHLSVFSNFIVLRM